MTLIFRTSHYDDNGSEQLTVDDPQFIFFIRKIPGRKFAIDVGFTDVEFTHRYDFTLSFAGVDRAIADAPFHRLQHNEFEVFYDKNRPQRIPPCSRFPPPLTPSPHRESI